MDTSLGPEKQIITADPDVTCHEITHEDEFLILACDGLYYCTSPVVEIQESFVAGIWECLTSQQVVDCVRYQVSQGKELSEIGTMICDHCLSPVADEYQNGCDNMTILIVAVLHGRTKGEWYAWVSDRVKNGYGYETPSDFPTLYPQTYMEKYHARELERKRFAGGAAGTNNDSPTTTSRAAGPSVKVGATIPSGTFSYIPYSPEFENNHVSFDPLRPLCD
jgi:hypothetical protein